MLKGLTFYFPHLSLRSPPARMFQRAASGPASRQVSSTNQPYKLSQSKILHEPLSPKKSSSVNVIPVETDTLLELKPSVPKKSLSFLHTINDDATSRYAAPIPNPQTNTAPVYFNEDDFDDDLDFSFDNAPIRQASQYTPASAISWAPSSYLNKTPTKTVYKKEQAHAEIHSQSPYRPSDTKSIVDNTNKRSAPSGVTRSSTSPVAKKPRLLPWQKDSLSQTLPGPKLVQHRSLSSAAAIKEEEYDEMHDNTSKVAIKADPHEMTNSAVKAAIRVKGRKRASDEAPAPQIQLPSQRAAGTKEVAKVFLSAEQRGVIDLLKTGKSVFFTGSAGTGKSVLLRTAIHELRLKHKQLEKVAVTASTGLAACNIGGITLHSFAGVGLGRDSVPEMVKKVKRNKKNVLKWTKTKVLVIDEISMVDAEFFDKLEAVARKLRGNDKPWGGIQLVATGDFFQLPPVPDQGKIAKFAFEAEKWKELDATIQLTTVFRQKDEAFVEMLNQMRTGSLTAKTIENFRLLQRPLQHNDGIIPTELFPTRNEVDNANSMRMRHLPGEVKIFDAEDSGSIQDLQARAKLLSNCMAPPRLELKKGCQVMLIKNRDEGLVNGSLGVVIGFMNERTYTYALDEQDGTFPDDELRDSPWTDEELAAMEKTPAGKRKLLKLYEMQQNAAGQKVWPLVRFKSPNGGQDTTQLMSPESWKIEQPNGDVQACRKQVPLILAYAISIHKAQGQTIERVKVDLGKVFEKGQAYVALSRAVSKDGLQILRFDAKKVMAHPKVAAFYRELGDASDAMERHKVLPTVEKKPRILIDDDDEPESYMSTQEVFEQIKREPVKAYKTEKPKNVFGRAMYSRM